MDFRYIWIVFLILPFRALGQVSAEDIDIELWIDRLFPVQEQSFEYNDVYDRMFSLYRDPVELNMATADEIDALIMLSEYQKVQLLEYRRQFGPILSIFELAMIPGWNRELAELIMPFTAIDRNAYKKRFQYRPSQHWIMLRTGVRLPHAVGYSASDPNERFQGPPVGLTVRYKLTSTHYDVGLAADQDAGEAYAWSPAMRRFGMDYYTYHVMVKNYGVLQSLIIGNYALQFGQGLVFGSGWRCGKGTDPIMGTGGGASGIRPYRSTFENRDFRGIAATFGFSHFEITGFWSDVRRDALPREDTLGDESLYTTYIRTAGLHRNDKELASRNTVGDRSFGANIRFLTKNRKLQIGTGAIVNEFNVAILPALREYNQHAFRGRRNIAGTLYGSYTVDRFHFFGEASRSKSGGNGLIAGLHSGLSPVLHMSVHIRKYDPGFHSLHGRGFGESGQNINENGVYLGLHISPSRDWQFNLFYDRFRFPWLRHNADAPSSGDELMFSVTHRYKEINRLNVQFRMKRREKNYMPEGHPVRYLQQEQRLFCRAEWMRRPKRGYWYRSRLQLLGYGFVDLASHSMLLAQDVGYRNPGVFMLSVRASFFLVDDWYSRQFAFEQGVLYSYSVPAHYGRGGRFYALATVHRGRSWTFWLKAGHTLYLNREFAGSGTNMRPGNKQYDLTAQLRLKL